MGQPVRRAVGGREGDGDELAVGGGVELDGEALARGINFGINLFHSPPPCGKYRLWQGDAMPKTLQTLELQLREAQSLAHFGSWEWDLREDRITWSEVMYQLMGVDRASFRPSAEAFVGMVHPEDRERVQRAAEE